ncbi:LemA family protein [Patescibacteria group bacterium]|nr:LemA family protein [Patescibacteria group bacterium]
MSLFTVLILAVVLAGIYLITIYNVFASLKIKIGEAWSQIDVQLKRRTDLIPNLVETVKGYASHEKEVFENVTQARSALMSAQNPKEAGEADKALTSALGRLFAVAENYPVLKAQEGFLNLQKELSDTEDKVAYSRQFYNSVVRQFNEKLAVFPSNLIGKLFGYKSEEFFEAEESERKAVKVDFSDKSDKKE